MKHIAISQRVISSQTETTKDALEHDYVTYYRSLGIQLHPVPNILDDVNGFIDEIDAQGIILSGGNNVGEYPARDNTEKKLLDAAIQTKIPVLGECRGMQLINIHFGGSLIEVENHVAKEHEVTLKNSAKVRFRKKTMAVNSYHRFGFTVKECAKALQTFAVAPDGVIEGVFHPTHRIAGVLWHPERPSHNSTFNEQMIKAFLERRWFWR